MLESQATLSNISTTLISVKKWTLLSYLLISHSRIAKSNMSNHLHLGILNSGKQNSYGGLAITLMFEALLYSSGYLC